MSQYLEKIIARHCIAELLAGGYVLSVNDGEETTLKRSMDATAIFAAMFTTDEDYLLVHNSGQKHFGWIHLIYGNEGWDVISDHTTNLEQAIAKTWKMVMAKNLDPIFERAAKVEAALTAAWDFIENVTQEDPQRQDKFFALREQVRAAYA